MKETTYKINVKRGSTDEIRVKKYLKEKGIEFSESTGVLGSVYIGFSGVGKEESKMIKKGKVIQLGRDKLRVSFLF